MGGKRWPARVLAERSGRRDLQHRIVGVAIVPAHVVLVPLDAGQQLIDSDAERPRGKLERDIVLPLAGATTCLLKDSDRQPRGWIARAMPVVERVLVREALVGSQSVDGAIDID